MEVQVMAVKIRLKRMGSKRNPHQPYDILQLNH